MQLSIEEAHDALTGRGRSVDGGKIVLYSSVDRKLAEIPLKTPAFLAPADRSMELSVPVKGEVLSSARVARHEFQKPGGTVAWSGPSSEVGLDDTVLEAGGTVIIEGFRLKVK